MKSEKARGHSRLESAIRDDGILDSLSSGLIILSLEGRILRVNSAFSQLTGYDEGELLGKHLEETLIGILTHPEDRERDLKNARRFLAAPESGSTQVEKRYIHKQGHLVWALVSSSVVREADGRPSFFIVQTQNITPRKQAQEALQESEERFRLLARATNDILWDWDIRTGEVWCSEGFLARMAATPIARPADGTISTEDWLQYIHPADREMAARHLRETLNNRERLWTGEFRLVGADGLEAFVSNRAYIVYSPEGTPVRMTGALVDISERKSHEHQMQMKAQEQAELLHQLLTAQEAERRRLSMDIHDGPLQSLGVTGLAVDRALRRLERGEENVAREEIASVRKMLSDTVAEIRAVLKDLSLDVLRTYGLNVAIQNYADWLASTTDIWVEVRNSLNRRLASDMELVLYRLVQEALANIRKHSEATQVRILLNTTPTREGEELELVIGDNGKGFDLATAHKRHESGHGIGLKSMEERIEAIGGSMLLYSERGEGTALTFRCPVRNEKVQKSAIADVNLLDS